MKTIWTQHLSDEKDKENFRQEVLASRRVLGRLTQIVEDQQNKTINADINPKTYEIPNWDYRQAHNNGYLQCLKIMKEILDLDQRIIKPNE